MVITDHNSIAGAKLAYSIDPQLVIVGEEIKTTCGELLAAYVKEEIPAGLEPSQAINLLRQQDAFISVSHPFDNWRGWRHKDLLEIIPLVDAIEVFNARCITRSPNQAAYRFAQQHQMCGTIGSDAHTLMELGRATMLLDDFSDAASLKASLERAEIHASLSPPWIHFASSFNSLIKGMIERISRL